MFFFGLARIRRFFIFHSVYNKGITRENLGEYPKALNLLFLALSLMPNSLKTYKAIIRVNRKNKTFLNGIDFCNKAISRFPKNSELYAMKADIYRKIKDYNEAITAFDEAIKYNGTNSEYYIERAYIKYLTDDLQGAINDCTGAIANQPDNYKLYEQRAFYQLEKKNYSKAEEDYNTALKLKNKAHLFFMLGITEKFLNKDNLSVYNIERAEKMGVKYEI